jgi:hypothetical protein
VAILDASVHRFTTDEYERIVGTGALAGMRVELLDGLLVDIGHPLAVGEGWVPEPDVALAEYEDRPVRPTTALFVAEVAVSSHARDARKALAYARAGIPVYWLVDVPAGIVRVHSQPGPDGYGSILAKRDDDVLDAGVEGVEPTTVSALLAL